MAEGQVSASAQRELRSSSLKRKRAQQASHPSSLPAQESSPSKKPRQTPRKSPRHSAEEPLQETEKNKSTRVDNPLQSWVLNQTWPRECFEPDAQARVDLLERDSWLEEMAALPPVPVVQYVEINGFRYPLPAKRTPGPLRRKQSDSNMTGSSDQTNREGKTTPYRDPRYPTMLGTKGSYMDESDLGITDTSLSSCKDLLRLDQPIPADSLFGDDVFEATWRSVRDRNEARVVRSISPYVVPSAEHLAIMGATHLKCLIENVNEPWTGSIPVEGPRPQPDYSVGFQRSAFTKEQLTRLEPLIGSFWENSFFVATFRMYFPFLTCEVKCGVAGLDVADRQNAHSMTIAVRGVIELYRAVKREKELDREILAFSISHDHSNVRIYGHYAVVSDSETTFYCHPIEIFNFRNHKGAEKWTAYRFTKNIYDNWMPTHLKRICSAIDDLPLGLDFQVPEAAEVQSASATGLSQDMGSLLSDPDNVEPVLQGDDELHRDPVPQTATPSISVAKGAGGGGGGGGGKGAKKPRTKK